MAFFSLVFVFFLGAASALLCASVGIYYYLIVFERKSGLQRAQLAKDSSAEESVSQLNIVLIL